MLIIERIHFETDQHQFLQAVDPAVQAELADLFTRTWAEGEWRPIEVRVVNGHQPRPDFLHLAPNCIVVAPQAREKLYKSLNYGGFTTGQMLPLPVGDEMFYIHTAPVVGALDPRRSVITDSSPRRTVIEEYVFDAPAIGEGMPLLIPETCTTEILTASSELDRSMRSDRWGQEALDEISLAPEDDFSWAYRRARMTGLRFDEIWRGGVWRNNNWVNG